MQRRDLVRTGIIGAAAAASPEKKRLTEEWDVVVVGADFAGMCAALEAAEKDAKTVLIEKVKETGLSFGAWRLRIIMLAATHHLLAGKRVEEVAEMLGYSSASAFTAAFRRVFGFTPGALRRGDAFFPDASSL